MEEAPEINTIKQQKGQKDAQHPIEREQQNLSPIAKFTAHLAQAYMNKLKENWLGIVIYYEDVIKNAETMAKIINNIQNFTKKAIQLAYLTAILMQPPAEQTSLHYTPTEMQEGKNSIVGYEIMKKDDQDKDWFPKNLTLQEENEHNYLKMPQTNEKNSNQMSNRNEEQNPQNNEPEATPRKSKMDILTTHEACLKYGEYALTCPTIIHQDVIQAIVREYRKNDKDADEIAHWIQVYANEFGINAEVAMTAFMLQESSFGKITGNLSGRYNIGNIRGKNGKFRDYTSYKDGVYAIFWQLDRYYRVWQINGQENAINNLDSALHVFAPPSENPTDERIEIAKEFIDHIRALSNQYEQGKIKKDDLQEEVYKIRKELQRKYGSEWV